MSDLKDLLKQVTRENILSIMDDLGSLPSISDSRGNLIFTCVCHGDQKKYKLYCYHGEDAFHFHCYVCGEQYSLIDLVAKVKKIEVGESIKYIKEKCGIVVFKQIKRGFGNTHPIKDWDLFSMYKTHKRGKPTELFYDDKVLGLFSKNYYQGWINEGISIEAMQEFDIRLYDIDNSIVIPHHDTNGRLIGIRKRNLDRATIEKGFKYMPLTCEGKLYTHQLMYHLYGLNKNKEAIKRLRKVIIFESEKSVLQCQAIYGNNNFSVACCGSNVSIFQRNLLLSLGITEVIIALDRQWTERQGVEYERYMKKIMNIVDKFCPYVNTYVIDIGMENHLCYKDSPSDRGKEILESLMRNKSFIGTVKGEVE